MNKNRLAMLKKFLWYGFVSISIYYFWAEFPLEQLEIIYQNY